MTVEPGSKTSPHSEEKQEQSPRQSNRYDRLLIKGKVGKPAPSKTKPGAGGAADRRRGTQQDEGGKIPRQSNRYGRVLVKGNHGQART